MKRILTLMLLTGFGSTVAAQSLQEALRHFDAGVAAVQEGRYVSAVQSFEEATAAGYESAALHYNRGVALYRLDQVGEAIASFERARRLDPKDRRVLHNLTIARAGIRDQMSRLPPTFTQSVWRWIHLNLGALTLFLAGLAGYLLCCGLLVARARGASHNEWIRRAVWISAGIALIGLTTGLGLSLFPAERDAAVVVTEQVAVYPDASESSDPELNIHEGLTVTVLSRSGERTAVRLPNGVTGWVASNALIGV